MSIEKVMSVESLEDFPDVVIVRPAWERDGRSAVRYVPDKTCMVEDSHGYTDVFVGTRWSVVLSCHTIDDWGDSVLPSFCPYCGSRVVS